MRRLKKFYSGWRKYLLDFLLIALVFIAVRQYQHQNILQGQAVPLDGILLDKTELDWSSYQDKPLLIHFWATWCSICRLEEASIQSISEDYNVITIASWSDDTLGYLQQQGLTFRTLDDVEGKWAEAYGIHAVPASFIINSESQIEFVETGYSSETGLRLRLWWIGI